MEEDIKIWKGEYLSNHWLDLTEIWNFGLGEQMEIENCLQCRRQQLEDDLKLWKVLDLPQILNPAI